MDFKHWYAIFVATGHEDSVKLNIELLLDKRGSVKAALFVPKRLTKDPKQGEVKEVLRPMFPGYVLVGTEQIEQVWDLALGIKGILKFLRSSDEDRKFQQVQLSEIARLLYMADESGVIGESEVVVDEHNQISVLSGPLKGELGYITKFDRRKGRVAVNFLFGTERHEIWLAVRVVE
jgi:transcriptional antiterminator NusG